jgi:uncharacterized damage-inducible protein DinB
MMSIAQSILPEFDHEMSVTRKLLERIPEDKAAWKPHEKSMTLGQLSAHIANMVSWTGMTLSQTELDLNPPGGQTWTPPVFETTAGLLEVFDNGTREAHQAIEATADADMMVNWSLKSGGHTVLTMPRVAVVRSFVLNHIIHHRGQLSVFLRLLDVPIPSIYGPSADESV